MTNPKSHYAIREYIPWVILIVLLIVALILVSLGLFTDLPISPWQGWPMVEALGTTLAVFAAIILAW